MAVEMQDREVAEQRPATTDAQALAELRKEVRAQRRETKRIYSGFAFFAATALVIAFANLVAVALKLDGTTKTVTVTAPAATAAPAAVPAPAHASAVTLSEFNVAPKPSQVASGPVTFNVSNGGKVEHEFVVIKTSKPASDLLKGGRADETGNVGEIGSVKPGQTKALKLSLTAGHYALLCNLPGHYAAGMFAELDVA
jgi:uncharacterized cupredoxin-like copper-binding protein